VLENLKIAPRYDGFLFLAESARNPPALRSHRHSELEINLVVRGEITYVAEGQRHTFGQRTLLWLFPAQEHQLIDRSPDAQYYVAVFKPDLIARSCRSPAYADLKRETLAPGVLHTTLEPESYDLVRKTMESLMEGSLDPDVLNREAGFGFQSDFVFQHHDPDGLNAGLHHLLLLSWRCHRHGRALSHAVSLHPSVAKAIRLLDQPDMNTLNLTELAQRCGVSPSYLSRIFARQMGIPLHHYRNSVRLGRFWELYHQPTRPTLTEAVYAAGFGSYAQFYKVFAQAYGCGPREALR
jgi:AraC-like DNA-binding protein